MRIISKSLLRRDEHRPDSTNKTQIHKLPQNFKVSDRRESRTRSRERDVFNSVNDIALIAKTM